MKLFAHIKEPASFRSIYRLILVLQSKEPFSNFFEVKSTEFSLEEPTFEELTLDDVTLAGQQVFPEAFDTNGELLTADFPIDGLDFFCVMKTLKKSQISQQG